MFSNYGELKHRDIARGEAEEGEKEKGMKDKEEGNIRQGSAGDDMFCDRKRDRKIRRLLGVMVHFRQDVEQTEIKKAIYLEGEGRHFVPECSAQFVWCNVNLFSALW